MKKHYIFFLIIWLSIGVKAYAQVENMPSERKKNEQRQYLQQAQQKFEAFAFDSALYYYQKAYFLDTLNKKSIRGIAKSLEKKGQAQFSKRYYYKILNIDDKDIGALYALATLYRKEKKYTKALAYFQTLHQIDTTNAFYYKKMALLYQDLKNDSLAILNYKKCLDWNFEDKKSAQSLATIYYKHKKYELANETLHPYINNKYVDNAIIRLYISILYQLNKYEQVIENGERLLKKNDSSVTIIKSMGLSYFQLQDYASSLKTFSLIPDNQRSSGVFYYMGLCENELQEYEKALDYFNQAITSVYTDDYHRFFIHAGFALEELKSPELAIQKLRFGYEITHHPDLIFHLARIYDEYYKDKSVALKHYQKYLKHTPKNALFIKFCNERIEVLKPIVFFQNTN